MSVRISYNKINHVFKDLFTRLNKIDPKAVEYLRSTIAQNKCRYKFNVYVQQPQSRNLNNLLFWSFTPQGHEYWRKLHVTLCPSERGKFRPRSI